MKHSLLFLLFILLGFRAFAQPDQSIRAELPADKFNSRYQAFALPDSAVLVLNQEAPRNNSEQLKLLKFDATLKPLWEKPIPLPRGSDFIKAKFEHATGYFIFETYLRAEYLLVTVNLKTGESEKSKHLLPEKTTFALSDFEVLDGVLFLTGSRNDHLTVLRLDPAHEQMAIVPAIYNQATSLAEFFPDTTTNRLEFIMTESNGRKARLQVKRLNSKGVLVSTNYLQHQRNRNFLTARLTAGDSLQKQLAGTFSLRDFRYAQGIFTGNLNSASTQQFRFYDFTEFNHYFEYLKPKRKERIRNRVSRMRENKKDYFLRHRVLLHPLRPYQNGFLLVGEMYYPHYQNTDGSNRIFDGYQFFQTIVAAFDKEGKLLWENSFPIKNTLIMDLDQVITAGASGQNVLLCYPDDELIRYKVISGDQTVSNDSVTTVKISALSDKLLSTNQEEILHWHGPHFLATGFQEIRGVNGRRRVFYLNKLSF